MHKQKKKKKPEKKEEDGTRVLSPADVQGPSNLGLRTEQDSYYLLSTRKPGIISELKA